MIVSQDTTHKNGLAEGIGTVAAERDSIRFRMADYANLLKPRVMALVVFTALVGMMLAPVQVDPLKALIAIVCIAVGAGASGAINMWYDRDIDIAMERTKKRPIPAGKIEPDKALTFGVILAVASVAVMYMFVETRAAGLLAFTIFYYIFVYTIWLKRRTPQNIVIGGAAGAFPPMIGWVAATGEFTFASGILFAIIFLWTPPHTWALALFRRGDYEKVGVPMMPVVVGARKTKIQILLYTLLLTPVTLIPTLIGLSGIFYALAALALGTCLIRHAVCLLRDTDERRARGMFFFTILYLFLIFAALLLDKTIYFPLDRLIG
ncbi:heme o synthase [Varunaivibrio sulfuroxidans]|uniref:Protoheme IX farnesyltransferase n=1 Tax=Varunaivibrio sulfuroxidans TaxID=1773489 RepID=A0A4R3J9L8_9PROT|nr:heme o synthase [Varunaivibrio sulfuroxidans]TCS62649.1 protoheme IX farnesyltransferase [Varunaivibrio sulfuroxidans]WES30685.1 heme o synthase [Varunaivibrio sulfuroxidans]